MAGQKPWEKDWSQPSQSAPIVLGRPGPKAPYEAPLAAQQLENERLRAAQMRAQLAKDQPVAADPRYDGVTGPDYLKHLSATDAAKVRALAEGRMAFPSGAGMRSPYWQQMIDHVAHYDPTFDAVNYQARQRTRVDFTSGKAAQNIRALNTAIGHLGELADQMHDTESGQVDALNAVGNYWNRHVLGQSGPTRYDQTAAAVASELTQVFRGTGGAEADVKRFLSELSVNASEEQKRAAYQNLAGLLQSRLDALGGQYTQGMGTTRDGLSLLNPHAQAVLQAVTAGHSPRERGLDPSKAIGAAGASPFTPPPAAPPPGTPTGSAPNTPPGPGGAPITALAGQSGYNTTVADGAFTTAPDPARQAKARQLEAMMANPATSEQAIRDFIGTFPADNNNAANIDAVLKARRDHPELPPSSYAGVADDLGLKTVPLTNFQQARNWAANTGLGTGAINAGLSIGALPNGITRLAGRAIGFDGDMRHLIAGSDNGEAMMQSLNADHPKSALAGTLIGGLVGAGGAEALAAKGLLKAGVSDGARSIAAPLIGDAAFGGLQGAGTAQQGSEYQGALVGGLAGAAGGALGRHVIGPKIVAPLLAPVVNSRAAVATGNAVRGMFGRAPTVPPVRPAASDLMVTNAAQKAGLPDIQGRLAEAQTLGVPMSLADTAPQFTSLGGAVVRRSPNADQIAQDAFLPRSRGQIDRLGQAVDTHLGPVGNVPQLSADLQAQARTAAAPLYEQAYRAPVISTPQIDSALNTPFGRGALSRAQTIAANEGRSPQELGITLDASGQPVLNPRPNQAIADHLAARSELDDAQQAFREARTSPADLDVARARVERAREGLRVSEAALSAAPDPGSAASNLGYTAQSLDYVKRGMDDTLEQYRNPMTNRLQLDEAGRAQLGVKNNLLNGIDSVNPAYAAARRAYAGPMQSRDALARGADANTANPNQLGVDIAGQSPEQMAQMQLGYRGALMDQANRVRFSGNPFDATLGNPAAEQRLSTLYPGNPGNADLLRTRDLESGLARSTNDILGNSKTAQRGIADQSFGGGDGGQMLLDAGLNLATGQVPIGLIAKKGGLGFLRDAYQMGVGKKAVAKADALAPLLFNTDPAASSAALDDLMNSSQAYRDFVSGQRRKVGRVGGMFGAALGPAASSAAGY